MRHFWSQTQAFLLFQEVSQLDKFEGAKFKYNNIIFKFHPKDTHRGIFDLKFNDFYFYAKLNAKTNSRTLASNMKIIFSNSSSIIQKSDIFSPQFKDFYFLYQTLQQGKFQSSDCKYVNGFSKLLSKTPK